jgi:plastocyanin domain-containing protein
MKKQLVLAFAAVFVFGIAIATSGQTRQKVTIRLGTSGYRPSSFTLKKGVPATLTFIRTTDKTCGKQIVLPAFGITEDLPLNEPVNITVTPGRRGTFTFTCGMHMLRGKIIVTEEKK